MLLRSGPPPKPVTKPPLVAIWPPGSRRRSARRRRCSAPPRWQSWRRGSPARACRPGRGEGEAGQRERAPGDGCRGSRDGATAPRAGGGSSGSCSDSSARDPFRWGPAKRQDWTGRPLHCRVARPGSDSQSTTVFSEPAPRGRSGSPGGQTWPQAYGCGSAPGSDRLSPREACERKLTQVQRVAACRSSHLRPAATPGRVAPTAPARVKVTARLPWSRDNSTRSAAGQAGSPALTRNRVPTHAVLSRVPASRKTCRGARNSSTVVVYGSEPVSAPLAPRRVRQRVSGGVQVSFVRSTARARLGAALLAAAVIGPAAFALTGPSAQAAAVPASATAAAELARRADHRQRRLAAGLRRSGRRADRGRGAGADRSGAGRERRRACGYRRNRLAHHGFRVVRQLRCPGRAPRGPARQVAARRRGAGC